MEISLNPLKRRKQMSDDISVPRTATIQKSISPRVKSAAEAAALEVEQLREDRDAAIEDKLEALKECRDLRHQIELLQEQINDLRSRGTIHQLERDQAVARTAELQGLFKSISVMLVAHLQQKPVPQQVASTAEETSPKETAKYASSAAPHYRDKIPDATPRPPSPDEMLQRVKP